MDDSSMRQLLRRAVEPEPPIGDLVGNSIRAGIRLRSTRRALGAASSAAAVAAISLVIALLTGAAGRPAAPVRATAPPAPGPSARQLVHGHWLRMPPSPLKMCGNQAFWDGRELIVIQEPADGCPVGAAAYDPRANRWSTIAAPPLLKHESVFGAAGKGQVVLVLNTGATYSWQRATNRWQQLGALPAGMNRFSVAWTGTTFLVTRLYHWKVAGTGQAFELAGRRWKPLPDLPQPATGRMEDAPAVVFNGGVYVFADVVVTHQNGQGSSSETGSVEVLRLTTAGWTQVPIGHGGPKSNIQLTQVRGAILAAGSSCGWICTGGFFGSAALLRPGPKPSVVRLKPPPGVSYPWNFAAGARAVVVTYSDGLGQSFVPSPPPGTCYIYDVATGTWQQGPTAPAVPHVYGQAYWTPYGVITLAQSSSGKAPALTIGGWLLRPAGKR